MEKNLTKTSVRKSRKTRATGIGAGGITEDAFGNYKIRAGQLNGVFVARAFPKHSERSQGLMAEAKGTSETDAIETLKAFLSERETTRTAARRWEARSVSSVATQEEFLEAVRQTSLSTAQQSMLKALALAGEDGLFAVPIMNAGGYKSQDAAIKALAKASFLIADFIGLDLSEGESDGPNSALRVLGYRSATDTDLPLHLTLHKELHDAIWQML